MQNEKVQAQILELQAELVRYANRLNRNNGEDIVQEAIIRLLNSEREFTENDNFRAYSYAVVRNLAYNFSSRKAEKTVQLFGKGEGGRSLSNDECVAKALDAQGARSAEAEVLRGEFSPEITNALSTLNEGIRETFLLITVDGLTYEECVEVQGIPIGTVMSRCNRAKKQLKKQLVGA
jgi:RNA polymerase sigma-70 factor (ECF subfamily)